MIVDCCRNEVNCKNRQLLVVTFNQKYSKIQASFLVAKNAVKHVNNFGSFDLSYLTDYKTVLLIYRIDIFDKFIWTNPKETLFNCQPLAVVTVKTERVLNR